MDAELKSKWVEALRSGEYKQAKGTLLDADGNYCCLGVLCKIAGLEIDESGDRIVGTDKYASIHAGYRPIYQLVANGDDGCAARNLSMRNDGSASIGRRWSFSEIADYIEQNL